MRASAALTSPPDLIRRRAIAIATFSLPWKYLFAVSADMAIFTRGSQSTSSVHSQVRFPSSPSRVARMFTTRSTSSNSQRIGTSASRSFGPISGSSSIIPKTRSITVLNSLGESKETPTAGQELELEPPDEGFFAVLARRDAAGLGAAVRRADARLDADERLVEDFDAVEDDAGFAADERLVEARRADAGLEAVEDLRAAGGRRAVGFLAAERLAAGADEEAEEASGRSSADTRLARPSTSVRRPFSSSTTRSS